MNNGEITLISAVQKMIEDINACTKTRISLMIDGQPRDMGADEEETVMGKVTTTGFCCIA